MPGTSDISASSDENLNLAGACTLLITLETEKDSGRMIIDAKIETLYQDSGDHILDLQILATLLDYVQKYCMGRDIKHLSIITMVEHPTWLTLFFTLAGFTSCACLKSDELEKGKRICLKLGKSAQALAKTVEDVSKTAINGAKENHTAAPKPVSQPPSLTIKATAPEKAPDGDEAADWLSRNHTILSPTSALAHAALAKSNVVQTSTKSVKQSPKIGSSGASEVPQPGEKRKHSDNFPRDHDVDADSRPQRRREENGSREPTKQEMREKEERLSRSLQKQREAISRATDKPSVRAVGTIPPAPPKSNSHMDERPQKNGDMTDGSLAQHPKLATSAVNIKKESTKQASPPNTHLTPAVRGGSPDPNVWRSNLPHAKTLTCFYWATQGYCVKDERDCLHAHHDTGEVARPPPSYKYKAFKNGLFGSGMGFDGAHEEYDPHYPAQGYKGKYSRAADRDYSQDQGMSIRGSENGLKNVKEEDETPTQPNGYQDTKLRPGDGPYDSYRPRH